MDCFFIMPIGIPETESIWEKVFSPIAKELGYEPRRIKEDDDGRSMDEQIVDYINNAALIIVDLTFARPNCYFEFGYARGIGRREDLILCCRTDHNPDSPDFSECEHKIHFDVRQYYVVWWDVKNLDAFSKELKEKIKQRESVRKINIVKEEPEIHYDTMLVHERDKRLEEIKNKSHLELKQWRRKT